MEPYDTSPEELDRVWHHYCIHFLGKEERFVRVFIRSYQNEGRKYRESQQFETWLFEYGARVIQDNKKRFIRFYSRDDAVMFMLQHG